MRDRAGVLIGLLLLALVAVPLPLSAFGWPEWASPMLVLLVAGGGWVALEVGRVSPPLGWLLAWALTHAVILVLTGALSAVGAPVAFLLMAAAGLFYVQARTWSERTARLAAGVLLASVGLQAGLGVLNLFGVYPSLLFGLGGTSYHLVTESWRGRPMGWLTHPNYLGSYLALGIPLAYALVGRLAALALFGLTCATLSLGAVVAGAVGGLVMAWPEVAGPVRRLVVLAVGGTILGTALLRAQRHVGSGGITLKLLTSGRAAVWGRAWPQLRRHWLVGNGLAGWKMWAVTVNETASRTPLVPGRTMGLAPPAAVATWEAHNEPYQLWFELGLVGVALAGWWLWTLRPGVSAALDGPGRLWAAVLAAALANSLVSPLFHLPAHAATALLAAARIEAAASHGPA